MRYATIYSEEEVWYMRARVRLLLYIQVEAGISPSRNMQKNHLQVAWVRDILVL